MSTKCTILHRYNFHLYIDAQDTETVYLEVDKPCGCTGQIAIPFEVFLQIADPEIINKAKEFLR